MKKIYKLKTPVEFFVGCGTLICEEVFKLGYIVTKIKHNKKKKCGEQ